VFSGRYRRRTLSAVSMEDFHIRSGFSNKTVQNFQIKRLTSSIDDEGLGTAKHASWLTTHRRLRVQNRTYSTSKKYSPLPVSEDLVSAHTNGAVAHVVVSYLELYVALTEEMLRSITLHSALWFEAYCQ
jgi:hypothetical protein